MNGYHEEEVLGKAYDARLMRRLLTYLRPYWKLILLSIMMLLAVAGLQLIGPYLIKIAIDQYITPKQLAGLERIVLLFLAALFLQFAVRYLQTYVMQLVGQRAMYDLRMQLFEHIQKLDLAFFDRNPVGRLVTRVTSDINVLNQLFTEGVVAIFGDIFMLSGIIIVMLAINAKLALITFASIPLLFVASTIFKRKARASYRAVRQHLARLNAFMQEHLSGVKEIQLFCQEESVLRKFDSANRDLLLAHLKAVLYYAVFFPTVDLIGALSVALLLWYGGLNVVMGGLSFGVLVAFIQYADMFYAPIRDLSEKYNILQAAMASSERVFRLLDTPPEIPVAPKPVVVNRLKGAIEFEDVNFAYNPDEPVLHNVSFSVQPGERIALVGATGAGKTSIIGLLCRFYEFQSGRIVVDGIDIRDYDPQSLRRRVALVLQDVFLFAGDVASNIRLGEDISEQRVRDAARFVNAHTFIERLPGGYREEIRERGSNLSAGQRQLLAFARAVCFDPDILILDEATSSVDTDTELLIQDALRKLMADRTSIIIAHRLSTIRHCDRILVMHKGKIREQGTHAELLRAGGIYSRLYQLQFKEQDATPAQDVGVGERRS